jgi:ferrous iron transport protein A
MIIISKKGEKMMSPLALLQEGETAEIIDQDKNGVIADLHSRYHRRRHGHTGRSIACNHAHLQDMGLRPGNNVEMITNRGTGPLVLRVDECRIAMGRGAAMKIYVRRITP